LTPFSHLVSCLNKPSPKPHLPKIAPQQDALLTRQQFRYPIYAAVLHFGEGVMLPCTESSDEGKDLFCAQGLAAPEAMRE
jgi:hypothetical protein